MDDTTLLLASKLGWAQGYIGFAGTSGRGLTAEDCYALDKALEEAEATHQIPALMKKHRAEYGKAPLGGA